MTSPLVLIVVFAIAFSEWFFAFFRQLAFNHEMWKTAFIIVLLEGILGGTIGIQIAEYKAYDVVAAAAFGGACGAYTVKPFKEWLKKRYGLFIKK